MTKIWAWYKKVSMWVGMIFIPLIIISLAMADWTIKANDWTQNIFDDMLYYAYNASEFGWIAEIWRFVTIYAIYFLFKTIILKAISFAKSHKKTVLEVV